MRMAISQRTECQRNVITRVYTDARGPTYKPGLVPAKWVFFTLSQKKWECQNYDLI